MKKELVIEETVKFVRSTLEGEGSGHDWWHIYRVWKNALLISKNEDVDMLVVQLATLLHDISDWKFNNGDATIGPKVAKEWMDILNIDDNTISHVCSIIKTMSFKGNGATSIMKTKEGKIVQDADRLDAIGAIGIARTFTYGGYIKQEIYNPNVVPKKHKSFEEYKQTKTTTINHFYEKLLLLKERMNLPISKEIAKKRHVFMEDYLRKFHEECNGQS
ncbi:HD domain-containing protein [Bacillus sp. SM2101]|uniref:HD domain-containing protein n=1 Tax=Bacillus sp. SM2101 TaxID=2805366 RepID=UPI001BDF3BC6|nr:HD domain-containing protein [Bacillus sp. SM2101]